MVRGKVQMKRIENASSRQVTFSKRRNGLLKKAYELSVLCDADVALIIFSSKGRLYEFSSSNMQKSIERYMEVTKDRISGVEMEQNMQRIKNEAAFMAKKIELLENSQRMLLGHNLGWCSMDELEEIENRLERSLKSIRAQKVQLFNEETEKLIKKEKFLLDENQNLLQKIGLKLQHAAEMQKGIGSYGRSVVRSEAVTTELFIGLPTPCRN
ncbi:MADS-box protein SOC1-like [Salvia miltiorrhiza]|uniref:MADS-box protein SOC1-like n=1 Tax=Salvia miltiorrhiza TaxID=226208 RepID=UPI0025AD398E|nr:MADS-box protein SOC1-like [Salvia miltiorrhiza]